ncbi:TetR/AcrR family transcriptional regulator [Streptomyces sp. NPDC058008]|uniref:TetR/AcrR family transcriptional regulator n=1 Tax=Streptomyces sp. NPDC058008 TaxID=3346303 RepID=UPI0036ED27D8
MASRARTSERRAEALSRERIIGAAVELLDAAGEGGLTFRALTERLATGPGAIYWHVANKSDLLDAATDAVVAAALAEGPAGPPKSPQEGIRAIALGLFDAIDAHPWLATQLAVQLSRGPSRPVAPRILESIGRQVSALGVPVSGRFTAASALMHHILGAAGQNAVNGLAAGPGADRAEVLDAASRAWKELDPDAYPFIRSVADRMRVHDDREEFLAGITLILAGIAAVHPRTG